MAIPAQQCSHKPDQPAQPQADKCQGGDVAVSLRVCLTCGYSGCCDSSPGKHARQHAAETGHQVMASYPADSGSFIWCYEHNDYLEPDDSFKLPEATS